MERISSRIGGFAAALLIACLSGLGIGSGGLLVIWLTMIEGISAETARGLNLLFFVFSASAALLIHLLKGRVKTRLVAILSCFSCLGTLIGTYLGSRLDPLLLKRIFGAMLTASGSYSLFGTFKKRLKRGKKSAILQNK